MSGLRIGSVCTGYGGLDAAVQAVLGGRVAWHCEYEPPTEQNSRPTQAAARLLAHRYPNTSNHGDVTTVNWASVEPVDVLTAGFPCQDVSVAGRRKGLRPDTRSGLWSHIVYAVCVLQPKLVVIENVRGLLSSDAHCDLEPCPWCLGDNEGRPLRALGAVLGDLASIGYDARWCGLRAADVGAPHGRFRVFITAWPSTAEADSSGGRIQPVRFTERGDTPYSASGSVADPDGVGPVRPGRTRGRRPGPADHGEFAPDASGAGCGPGIRLRGPAGQTIERNGAPPFTDAQSDGRGEGRPEPAGFIGRLDAALTGDAVAPADGNGFASLSELNGQSEQAEFGAPGQHTHGHPGPAEWGPYEPAIRRWELILSQPAPAPTLTGKRGGQQLSPRFVEWLMGLPAGWVADVPGLSRNDQLKLLGNGVVPQQAEVALWLLLSAAERAA